MKRRGKATPAQVRELRRRLNAAFADLRRQGFIARQSFSCCRGCASYELAERVGAMYAAGKPLPKGAVYYTRQDAEDRDRGAELMIPFGRVYYYRDEKPICGHRYREKELVCETPLDTHMVGSLAAIALANAGLVADWDGDPDKCIRVSLPAEAA